jgi:hypothetical protein
MILMTMRWGFALICLAVENISLLTDVFATVVCAFTIRGRDTDIKGRRGLGP